MGTSRHKVLNGIDRAAAYRKLFSGKKLGLIASPAGVSRDMVSSAEVLKKEYGLTALFSPEHGFYGSVQAGEKVDSFTDRRTGVPVHSLYGEDRAPDGKILAGLDCLVMDVQDVGARYYTFASTMAYAMRACGKLGKLFIVLDRPNPLAGLEVEGNLPEPGFSSFVGLYPVPVRHGLTMGELALLFQGEHGLDCPLEVVRMKGWKRSHYFDDTDLSWVPPSPNIPSLSSALVYPGTCLFEGTNISEARGTALPFEQIGAPWLDPFRLAEEMNAEALPGVVFRPVFFTPSFSKHSGKSCAGVQAHVTDRGSFKPVLTGLTLLYAVRDQDPAKFEWLAPKNGGERHFIDLLAGTDKVRLNTEGPEALYPRWTGDSGRFRDLKKKYHLY